MNPCTDGADVRQCEFDTSLGNTASFNSETLSQTREQTDKQTNRQFLRKVS